MYSKSAGDVPEIIITPSQPTETRVSTAVLISSAVKVIMS